MSSTAAGVATPVETAVPPADPTLDALRRALTGTYDVERLLGAGGMGSVYLGHDWALDRKVAIKVVTPDLAASPTVRERFLREARTVARLRHPNIVTVYAAGESAGALYFVMQYVPGESLRDRLTRDGRWDDASAVAALRDLAAALGYAHGQGVVHRDVKPENVLLDAETGRVMLTDFGVAGLIDHAAPGSVTGPGIAIGSPQYMSPEQAAAEYPLDGRSDVYALGLVGWEMFAGSPAVPAAGAAAMMAQHLTVEPPALETVGARVPPAVAAAIGRALAKRPSARWPDGSAMARALDAALRPSDTPDADDRAPRSRRWRLAAAAVVALVAALGVWRATAARDDVPRGVDPRKSYLVAPFDVLGPDPQLAWLREGSVGMLTLDLAQWRDLTVVDYEHGLDLQRDLKLDGARIGLDDARRMARRAGAWTVVTGQVTATPDSLLVDARVYDVASGARLDAAHQGVARGADPRPLFDALARDLLALAGAPPISLALARSTTTSVAAYRDYLEGLRALNGWQLARADSLFDAATRADSTFALAYYKRAVGMGWRDKEESGPAEMVRLALRYEARLPARQRALLDAFAALNVAFAADRGADTTAAAHYADAQRKYAAIVARDSGDAEAWYGLGDAYYHDLANGLDAPTVMRWSRALRAFNRTLALDSTFHLAYSHVVDTYQQAARPGSPMLLDGDTLRFVDDAIRRSLGAERLAAMQRRAQALALRDAGAWAATDPVPPAFLAVAESWLPSGRFDSAAAVLAQADARPDVRGRTELPFVRAEYLSRVDPSAARAALGAALRAADAALLRTSGGADRFPYILQSAAVAAMGGDLRTVDAVARLAAAAEPTPYNSPISTAATARWWAAMTKLAAGAPAASQRAAIDEGIAAIDALPSVWSAALGPQSAAVPYIAYAATRDPRYLATLRRWRGPRAPAWTEVDALEALAAGDTARARAIARGFPSADSARMAGSRVVAGRWVVRAEVLEALGDRRGALAAYDVLEPARIIDAGYLDPGMTLWARSFLARGRLHEELGERAAAAEAYGRFLALWQDADPALQGAAGAARAGLARVRDGR